MPTSKGREKREGLAARIAAARAGGATGQYMTTADDCNCPDHRFRGRVCKHMRAVRGEVDPKPDPFCGAYDLFLKDD